MSKLIIYSNTYIEKVFQFWYSIGCPSASELYRSMNGDENMKDEYGRIPNSTTLSSWMDEKGFRSRADLLDAKAATQIDNELVALKVNMLREQAADFRAIRKKAAKFLLESDFDSSSAAVNAFIRSSQEERIAHGLSKAVQKIAVMDDDDLLKQVRELASKVSGDILDVDEVEDENAESKQ